MISTIQCPVCGRENIEASGCLNCETDLSILKMLQELPISKSQNSNISLAILLVVISLLASFILGGTLVSQINLFNSSANKNQTIVKKNIVKTVVKSLPCIKGFYYRVHSGDSLSLISRRFYGKATDYWQISKANSQLKNRENNLEIGEVILIPNNIKEYTCGFISDHPEIKSN
jgi:LysM repeat protein